MAIQHNHAYEYSMRTNLLSNNCPKCQLDKYAEDLLLAAEDVLATQNNPFDTGIYYAKGELQTVIEKIRSKNEPEVQI